MALNKKISPFLETILLCVLNAAVQQYGLDDFLPLLPTIRKRHERDANPKPGTMQMRVGISFILESPSTSRIDSKNPKF